MANGRNIRRWGAVAMVVLGVIAVVPGAVGTPAADATSPTRPTVTLSTSSAGAGGVAYTIAFAASPGGGIPSGGSITLIGPPGTLWPHSGSDYSLTDSTTPSGSFSSVSAMSFASPGTDVYNWLDGGRGAVVTVTVPNAIAAGDILRLSVDGVVNPDAGTLALALATSADSTAALSAPYEITPPSSVSPPSVTLTSTMADAAGVTYGVGFATSSGGGIPAGGTITLVGPAGTVWPNSGSAYSLTDSTTPADSFVSASGTGSADPGTDLYNWLDGGRGAAVTVTVPNAVAAGDAVHLAVAGVVNPSAGTGALRVVTSTDTAAAVSASYTIVPAASVTTPTVTLSSYAAAATAVTYTVGFATSSSGALPSGGSITIIGGAGTAWPTGGGAYALTDLTTPTGGFSAASGVAVADNGSAVTVTVPNPVAAGDALSLVITGVTNPGGGSGSLTLSTSGDRAPASSGSFSLTGGGSSLTSVGAASFAASSTAAGATGVTYTVGFDASATGTLVGGSSAVTLVAPPGTVFGVCPYGDCGPSSTYDFTDLTTPSGSGQSTAGLTGDGSIVTIPVPDTIQAGDHVVLTITAVTNPPAGTAGLQISTSSDVAPVTLADTTTAGSPVATPSFSASTTAAGATGVTYTAGFTASATGDLIGGAGAITLVAPEGTIFGGCPYGDCGPSSTYTVTDLTHPSGSGSAGQVALVGDNSIASIDVPSTIQAGDQVVLTITAVTNPPAGAAGIQLSTSSDTVPVSLADTTVTSQSPVSATLDVSSPVVGVSQPTYVIGFTASGSGTLLGDEGTIDLVASGGIDLAAATSATITDTTHPSGSGTISSAAVVAHGSVVSYVVPDTIEGGDAVRLTLRGVTDPSTAGPFEVAVSTSSDGVATELPFTMVSPRSVTSLSAAMTPAVVGVAGASLSTFFTLSPVGGLADGVSTITFDGPTGMVFPSALSRYQILDSSTGVSTSAGGGSAVLSAAGSTATFPVPYDVHGGDQVAVTVTGVTNPTSPGTDTLVVTTSSDPVPDSTGLTFGSGAQLTGTVTQQVGGNVVDGATVQACPTAGGSCLSTATDGGGSYSFLLSDGTYAVTASAPSLTPSTSSAVISGTTATTQGFVLGPQEPLPNGMSVTDAVRGTQTENPYTYNSESTTFDVTGCPNGYGFALVGGTVPFTMQVIIDAYPLTEDPVGSGQYVATIPPLAPIHGSVLWSSTINCLPETALVPNGGTSAGGTQVEIDGTGLTGATQVLFGSTPAPSFQVVNDSEIVAVSPPGTGTVDVTVGSPQWATATHPVDRFTYNSVTGVSPTAGPAGTPVTIDGSGFTGATSVFFGDQTALSFSVVSDTEIVAVAPPGQVGTVDLQVFTPDSGTSTTPVDRFSYAAVEAAARRGVSSAGSRAVLLSTVHPLATAAATGPAGTVGREGPLHGTSQTTGQLVANAGLAKACGALNKQLGKYGAKAGCDGVGTGDPNAADAGAIASIECLYYVMVYHQSCPNEPKGGGYIDPSGSVVDTHGNPVVGATVTILQAGSAAGPYTAVPPGSADIEPSVDPETTDGQGEFAWDVLAGYYEIQASKPGCTSPTDSSQSTVGTGVLEVPPPQVGLSLTLDCGPSSSAPPTVTGMSPSTGTTSGGTSVTISGTGLRGVTSVAFGAAGTGTVTSDSATAIQVTTPASVVPGPIGVTVTTPGGSVPAGTFTYLPVPSISSSSDQGGPPAGGTPVTLTGDFGTVSSVMFGSAAATFTEVSPTELTVVSPPGTGTVPVTVTSVCLPGVSTAVCGVSAAGGQSTFTYGLLGFSSGNRDTVTAGQHFSFTVSTYGGVVSKLKLTGKLPKGVSFRKVGVGTGSLAGTPTAKKSRPVVGTYTVTITATFGKKKTAQVVSQTFVLTVN